jgi:hypothetical protein
MTDDDHRAKEGLEHLQAAAIELIEAARAFLDVAEDVVSELPDAEGLVGAVSDLVRSVTSGRPPRENGTGEAGSRVERIRVE